MSGWTAPGEGLLVVGVGASRGVPVSEVVGLVEETLRTAGLATAAVAEVATVVAKAGEPGVLALAEWLGVPLVTHPADRLARVPVPHPSAAPLGAVGTPSVAEAAALASGGVLLVPKRVSRPEGRPAGATCAVVRRVSITEVHGRDKEGPGSKSGLDVTGDGPAGEQGGGLMAHREDPRTGRAGDSLPPQPGPGASAWSPE